MNDSRPNLLLIMTDQQRGDCMGLDRHAPDVLQTPHMDALAAAGAHFHRAYSECPSCVPARRSLMTGMSPAAQGMVGYRDGVPWQPRHTLTGELRRAGYQTHLVGKLHLPLPEEHAFEQGEETTGFTPGSANAYQRWLHKQGYDEFDIATAHGVDANSWVGRPHHLSERHTHSYWCVSEAIHALEARDRHRPFFLKLSFNDPHPPLTPPAFYYDRYIHRDLPEPVVGDWARRFDGPQKGLPVAAHRIALGQYDMQCCRAAYYGMVNFVDDQIGRLIVYLSRRGLLRNTMIVFCSDHGEMLGDHQLFRKTYPYEASARVPFFIRPAAGMSFEPGMASDAPVGLQDVMPTLLDAAGVAMPETCTGRSLLPLLRGETAGWRDTLHGEHASCYEKANATHFLVDRRHKYVWHSITGREQLFDLHEDPHETVDLAADGADDAALQPWRQRLVDVLQDRPERFVRDGRLTPVADHDALMPGYRPDWCRPEFV